MCSRGVLKTRLLARSAVAYRYAVALEIVMKLAIAFAALLTTSSVMAAPMRFEWGGGTGRCDGCGPFIQATGDITPETPAEFERFMRGEPYAPKLVRLHSQGGDLAAGLALGAAFRRLQISTEVGSDKQHLDWVGAYHRRLSEREPGLCASACAYAFLGGVERVIEDTSRIGFHRFYRKEAVAQPSLQQFTGEDLDTTQKAMAGLLLYTIQMGVDARLIAMASDAGSDEMRWLTSAEARDLKVTYRPGEWRPWRIEPHGDAIVAVSETTDGKARMTALCSRKYGFQVSLLDRAEDDDGWFKQVKDCSETGRHPVFGAQVEAKNVGVFKNEEGAGIVFVLPNGNPPLTSPSLLEEGPYPMVCRTERYRGSAVNFASSVRLAFRNCGS